MRRVIYDQYHWQLPNHIEIVVEGTKKECLEQYRFYTSCYPQESLGYVTEERFKDIKDSINNIKPNDKAKL